LSLRGSRTTWRYQFCPKRFSTLQQIALSYQVLGRYAEAIAALDQALSIVHDNVETRANRDLY